MNAPLTIGIIVEDGMLVSVRANLNLGQIKVLYVDKDRAQEDSEYAADIAGDEEEINAYPFEVY